jgi:endonuclease/exonuclease/phosphatase family metal-dependent hydrolase
MKWRGFKTGSLCRVRVLTWNLFHGRAKPVAGRPLLVEFCAALAGWDWDVALLQEVPPWWPPLLAHACAAEERTARTSRNHLLPLRRAIASRNPDLLGANGGGSNAILVRGLAIHEHRAVELTRRPERRVAHGVRLDTGWVVNLHATTDPKSRTHADLAAAVRAFPGAAVIGGDLNTHHPRVPDMQAAASHRLDHVFSRTPGRGELLDAGSLSDHRSLLAVL